MKKDRQLISGVHLNLILLFSAICWTITTWYAGEAGRVLGVISAAGFMFFWSVISKLFMGKSSSDEIDNYESSTTPRSQGMLIFFLSIIFGLLYVVVTILAAPRGLHLKDADAALPIGITLIGLLLSPHKKALLFSGVAIGLAGSVFFAHQTLPKNAELAGLDEPIKGAKLEISWHPGGLNAWLFDTLDPPMEFKNDVVKTWTVEKRWQTELKRDQRSMLAAIKNGATCHELQIKFGADRLIEIISWLENKNWISDNLKCSPPRQSALKKKLQERMSARGEESAAAEALMSRNINAAIARAKLAVTIYTKADYARAVMGGCLLRKGILEMRTGIIEQALLDLREALIYLKAPSDRTRALHALDLALRF